MGRTSLLALAALLAAGDASAEPRCTAAARVSGAPSLVAPVVDILRQRGVPVGGTSECGAITAVLASEDERVRITIIDTDGRTIERVVDDVEGAATAVESWARGDLVDPLLAARDAPLADQAPDREPPPVIQIRSDDAPARRGIDIAALADATYSGDGAWWTGAHAEGCVRLGAICLGGQVRYAIDTEQGGDSADLGSSRRALDLMFTVDVPRGIARGRFELTPGAGIGQTSIRSRREEVCDACEDDTVAMLLGAHLAASARLTGSWSVRVDLATGYAPFGRRLIGETDQDPDDEPPLAGAPRWRTGLALGLSYGGL